MNLFSDGIFAFTFGGKTFSYPKPQPESDFIFADETNPIRVVNEFLMAFANAPDNTITFSAADLKSTPENPILAPLHKIDYETIRLRLRTISSLNPIVNLKTEEGIIQFSFGLSTNQPKEVRLRSLFAAKGQSITLEKLSIQDLKSI